MTSEATIEFVYDSKVVGGKKVSVTWAEVRIRDRISIFVHQPFRKWTYVHTVHEEDVNQIDPFLPKWGGRALDHILTSFIICEAKEAMKEFAADSKVLKSTVCHVRGKESGVLWTQGFQVLIDLTDEERGAEVIAVGPALPEWRESELRQFTPQLNETPRIGDAPNLEMLQWRA